MTAIQPEQIAPDFSVTDLEGQTRRLAEWNGKPVLLTFFTTNCSWCQVELPKLAEVFRRLNDVNVGILGIVVGSGDAAQIAAFAREKMLDFPLAIDASGEARHAYGLERVPTLVLVNADGKIGCVYQGSTEQLVGIVEQTVLSAARGDQLPEFSLIGNGCAPD